VTRSLDEAVDQVLAEDAGAAPSGMDLGVTEPLPKGPVVEPLQMVREPQGRLLAQSKALARQVSMQAVEGEVRKSALEAEVDRVIEEEEQGLDQQIKTLHEASLTRNPTDHAAVLDISSRTGVKPDIIEQRLPEFRQKMQAADFDARKFRSENPELAKLLLENPSLGPIAFHDKTIPALTQALRFAHSLYKGEGPIEIEPSETTDMTAAGEPTYQTPTGRMVYRGGTPTEVPGGGQFGMQQPPAKVMRGGKWVEQEPMVESPLATTDLVPVVKGPLDFAIVPAARLERMVSETFKQGQKTVELGRVGAELMDRRKNGLDTWDLEKKVVELKNGMGQKWYNAGPAEQLALDAAEILPSSLAALKGAGIGAGIGAAVAGGLALAVTKQPAIARAAALKGAAFGSKPGVFIASYNMERGSQYLQYLDMKTDDGQPIPEPVARGAAQLYGFMSAGVETAFFPAALKMFGPAGDAMASGSGKAFFAGLMRNPSARKVFADFAKRGFEGALAEGKEESIQNVLGDAIGWVTKAYTAGGPQKADPVASMEDAIAAGTKAFRGSLIPGVVGATTNLGTTVMMDLYHRDLAHAAGAKVSALAEVAETSETSRAAPQMIAELVKRETEKSGEKVSNLYVDAAAFERLFQAGGADAAQAATELMGEDGPRKLQEALSGANQGRLEVPIGDYLEKWGGKKVAKELAQDTTTRPGLLTVREQVAQDKEIETRRKALVAEYTAENAPAPESGAEQRLVEAVGAQLARTGVYKPAEAKQAVALTRAFLRTQAEVAGVEPDSLFSDYALTVERETQAARPATALAQQPAEQMKEPTAEEADRARWATTESGVREREMFIDPGTGLLNERAFLAQGANPARPLIAHISVEGVKYANKASHEVGNALYAAAANALAAVVPDAAKVKGDFAIRVQDEAELQAILKQANENMPAQGFAITGALGSTLEEAQAANIAQKTAAEKAGTRATRGRRPKGLKTRTFAEFMREVWKGPPASVVGSHLAAVEGTVIDETLKQAFRDMPEEESFRSVHIDPTTGFLSQQGFKARPAKAHVVSLDLNKLKKINNEHGMAGGDLLIAEFVRQARELGGPDVDMAHFSGDEFAAQSDDLGVLQAFIDDLGRMCDDVVVKFPDGKTQQGIRFGYGIGESYAVADKAVESSKGWWARKRERTARQTRLAERNAALDRGRGRLDQGREGVGRGVQIPSPAGAGQATAVGPRLAQPAYHGSPHRFSKFTLDHIGTGEGAQAYGYGLYFAGSKDVGEYYREMLKPEPEIKAWSFGDVALIRNGDYADYSPKDNTPKSMARASLAEGILIEEVEIRKAFSEKGIEGARSEMLAIADKAIDYADKENPTSSPELKKLRKQIETKLTFDATIDKGQLYKVELPEDSQLLDYDKPISDQSPEIQKKLAPIIDAVKQHHLAGVAEYEGSEEYEEAAKERITGFSVYSALEDEARTQIVSSRLSDGPIGKFVAEALKGERSPAEAASRTLLALGIPGLRYLDQGSRTAGEGTHNYVIWDEAAIRDLETFYQGERGYVDRMQSGLKKIFKVVLTDKADLSTFLHESSHVFLDVMGDLAARPEATERLRADWAKTLEWLGVKDGSEITVEQHEKWARAFETYLREGKAPSAELAGAFQRFKLWLTAIYKALAPGDIDDEIRGVFDRMLATDDEIARMNRAMGAERSLFRTPEEAGMTASEFQAYLDSKEKAFAAATAATQRRVIKDQIRATETVLKAERIKALEDAGREYDARPENVAVGFLKDGQAAGNALLEALLSESGTKVGLDTNAVSAAVGEDVTNTAFRGMTEMGGMSPDELAEIVSAPDGATLLKAIAERQDKVEWSRKRADELLAERTPDITAEKERLSDLAAQSLHEEGNSDWLLKEWQALRKRRGEGQGQAPLEAIRGAARDIVEATPVGRLYPGRILASERSAANRAAMAAAKGNWKLAAVEKQKQVLNHYLHRETTRALENRERLEKLAGKLTDRKRREALGKGGKSFLDATDTILEALGFKDPETNQAALMDRATTPEWMAALEAQGILPVFAADRLSTIIARPPATWKDLAVADAEMIRIALSQLWTAARDVNQVMLLGRRVQIEEVIRQIGEDTKNLPNQPRAPASDSQRTIWYRGKQLWQGISAAMLDPEQMFRDMGETARRLFWDRYTEQRDIEDGLANDVLKFFLEKWEAMPGELQDRKHDLLPASELAKLPFPEDVQRDGSLRDRAWMYMLALNVGTRSNLDRLLGGYQWDEQAVRDFLARNMKPEEWAFVQGVWDLMDKELYPIMAKQYESANGAKPDKIEALPFTLPDGTVIQGGYFPARYDSVASRLGANQREEALTKLNAAPSAQATLVKSFTKARAKKYEDVINLQWGEVPRHVAQVIHYVAFDSYIRDAGRVLAGMQNVVGEKLGEKYYTQMKQWLRVVASPTAETDPEHLRDVNWFLGEFRSRFVTSTLGFSLTVAMGDLTNAFVAIAGGRTKSRYATAALVTGLVKMDEITALSPELRHRKDTMLANMRRNLSEVGRGSKTKFLETVREAGWYLFALTDRMGSAQIWKGAYEQNRAAGMSEAESIREADSLVRRMLPSHDPAEQPAILRDRRGLGALIAFMGYFNKLWNIKREILRPALISWAKADGLSEKLGTLPTVGHAAARVMGVILVSAVIAELLSGRGPEDDEDWTEWAMRKALAAPAQDFPVVGQVGEPIINAAVAKLFHGEVRRKGLSLRASPVFAGAERVWKSLSKLFDEEKEPDDRILAALEVVGFGFKVPVGSSQVGRTGRYVTSGNFLEDITAGRPGEAVGGLLYGERENQPTNIFTIGEK
jgi:GGDEF domain-containing protein